MNYVNTYERNVGQMISYMDELHKWLVGIQYRLKRCLSTELSFSIFKNNFMRLQNAKDPGFNVSLGIRTQEARVMMQK